jgi:hypothetical protein
LRCIFLFSFTSEKLQETKNLLKCFLAQLAAEHKICRKHLVEYYRQGRLDQEDLLANLRLTLGEFKQGFIVIDALDECGLDEHNSYEEILRLLRTLQGWEGPVSHGLVTSREILSIKKGIEPLLGHNICITSTVVDTDIRKFIVSKLQKDSELRKWSPDIQEEIQSALVSGANGM